MEKALVKKIFESVEGKGFSVEYWDGETEHYGEQQPQFKLKIKDPRVLRKMLTSPELAFGEAYMDKNIEIEGDLQDLLETAIQHRHVLGKPEHHNVALKILQNLPWKQTVARQEEDVRYHYDLGNEFYAMWLDETLSYSCAYFKAPDDDLKQAQIQKIDHILGKLQLKPGHTLLDIGSGWGWLIIRAAQKYGVKAVGINISHNQVEKTKERIVSAGLEGQVECHIADYRTLAAEGNTFDRIVSVGMFEHVGRSNQNTYLNAVSSMLNQGGLSLLHTITHLKEDPLNAWIEKYIFPGGYIPSLREIIWQLPEHKFHLIDVESLRLHYALTLERWADNYQKVYGEVVRTYGEKFARMWDLYLSSCAASFRCSGLDVHQILFSKGLNNNLYLTREHLYKQG